jgi:uncharacterized protein
MDNSGITGYIKRDLFDEVVGHLDKPEITLVTGSRQVGKTVLLEQARDYLLKNRKVSPGSVFTFNLDIIQDWEILHDQTRFIELLRDRSRKQKIYVFIDEAQKVPEAARFFKGVFDAKIDAKLILTGSSSLEFKAKFKETLAGRKRIFQLSPFSFHEFLLVQDKYLSDCLKNQRKLTVVDQQRLLALFKNYMTFGGYPRVVLSEGLDEKRYILKEIYSSYIEKDAVGFFEIKNKTAYNRLIKLLAAQTGQLINIGELSAHLAIDRATVERYILALEDTFIIRKITPYFRNPRQEIIKAGKIYFMDLGIRNLALENFMPFDDKTDKGLILENAAFIELLRILSSRMGELHFWRTKQGAEVDFVIEQGLELLPVEVKSVVRKETIPTGLRSFIEKFNPDKAIITNLALHGKFAIACNTRIDFVYPFLIEKYL